MLAPKLKDTSIAVTCSNLIMAGILLPSEVPTYMTRIVNMNDNDLAMQLRHSYTLLDNYYQRIGKTRGN